MILVLLMIIPIVTSIYAQATLLKNYSYWSRIIPKHNIQGFELANSILQKANIYDVTVIQINGHLTDYYDPIKKIIALSSKNYYGNNLASLGIVAHEVGHAIQDKEKYFPLKIRLNLIPITNLASRILPFTILGGLYIGIMGLVNLGVIIYLILTFFQLVTLPVEYNASKRAEKELIKLDFLHKYEISGIKKILNSAALTYLSAFIASLSNLIYFFILSNKDD